jgi:hypothetical protein
VQVFCAKLVLVRGWVANVLSVVAVVGIAVGGWQLIVTRQELRSTRQQLTTLGASSAQQLTNLRASNARELAQARTKEQSLERALTSEAARVSALEYLVTTTTTVPVPTTTASPAAGPCPVGVIDNAFSSIDNSFSSELGYWPSQAQEQAFASQICAQEGYSSADVAAAAATWIP